LWEHPKGWECRVVREGRLWQSTVFADVRMAHLAASSWLTSLSAERFGDSDEGVE